MTTKEELAKQTLPELKAALKALGQPVSGKKDELVERLLAAKQSTQAAAAAPVADTHGASAAEPAAEPAPKAADPTPAAEDAAPAPEKPSKHARIVFSEEAIKAVPTKITVIRSSSDGEGKSDTDNPKASAADKLSDVEKAKQRALRFGVYNEDLEKERARKRAERFGTYNEDLELEKKLKRAERFGVDDPEARLALRAARFGLPKPTEGAKAAAGAGKASGSGTVAAAKGASGAKAGGVKKLMDGPLKAGNKKPGAAAGGGGGGKGKEASEFEKKKQERAARFGA